MVYLIFQREEDGTLHLLQEPAFEQLEDDSAIAVILPLPKAA